MVLCGNRCIQYIMYWYVPNIYIYISGSHNRAVLYVIYYIVIMIPRELTAIKIKVFYRNDISTYYVLFFVHIIFYYYYYYYFYCAIAPTNDDGAISQSNNTINVYIIVMPLWQSQYFMQYCRRAGYNTSGLTQHNSCHPSPSHKHTNRSNDYE